MALRSLDLLVAFFAIIASCGMIIVGIFGIYNAAHMGVGLDWTDTDKFHHWSGEKNPYFASAQHASVLVVLGLVGFLAELGIEIILTHFHLISLLIGKGLFYIVGGYVCLGIAGNLGIVVGTGVACVGVLFVIFTLLFGNRDRLYNYEYAHV